MFLRIFDIEGTSVPGAFKMVRDIENVVIMDFETSCYQDGDDFQKINE